MRRNTLHRAVILAALCLLGSASSHAADQALIDAAKKEGSATWYTTAIIDQFVRPAAEAFEKKYGVKVNYVRANVADIALRVLNEARAGQIGADLIDGTTTSIALERGGFLDKWVPDNKLPARYVDPQGYWIAMNQYVLTPGINTDLVPRGSEPKTWQDLLDPKWKGKMAWGSTPSSSAGQGFVGLVLREWGEEKGRAYLKELAKQNIAALGVSARQVLDETIAGEYAIALQIFNNHTTISAAKGAPVTWLKMEPALAVLSAASITKNSPHPNAGKLLLDFMESPEGQKIIAAAGELPVDPNVPPTDPDLRPDDGHFRAIYLSPAELDAAVPQWTKIYDEIFR
ncbi:MAG TPA: extracellular solute-binding protein [Beijerinckiaceae bacterium]|nr:extracellular solute-binding protein [Beijerinckiaceae bacterium]